jgi:hypothetical protein
MNKEPTDRFNCQRDMAGQFIFNVIKKGKVLGVEVARISFITCTRD